MLVSRYSALLLYSNPYDLCLFIGERDDRHSVYISFGPSRRYQPIITTEPVFLNREAAVASVEEVLNAAIKIGEVERAGGDGKTEITGLLLGAEGPHLDDKLRDRILADLRSEQRQADTFEYEQAA